jgi:hypothetical protein
LTGDPLIKKFNKYDLTLIKESNLYHSPELSESDEDKAKKRKIVVKDLEWRSSTVSLLSILFSLSGYTNINNFFSF